MHSDRNHGSYKYVILCFILVVRVVDMSGSAHQIPVQNWIAEPRFLRIYLRPLHCGDHSDFFSYCHGVKGLEPDRGLDRHRSFW